MVACVLHHRFALVAALAALEGRRREALAQLLREPVALAPEPGRRQLLGEVSAAAEAFGIVPGMGVGEALARCQELRLVPPDPEGVRVLWRELMERLEAIGAQVESDRPGQAFFDAAGLRGLHGGHLDGVLRTTRRAAGRGARIGVGPGRFSAYAAALRARPRRRAANRRLPASPVIAPGEPRHAVAMVVPSAGGTLVVPAGAVRAFLAPLPVSLLRSRAGLDELTEALERLGVRTLGELAGLPAPALAERFGHPGLHALDLANGLDRPLTPRMPHEPVSERLELPEAASGPQLERALELLIARLLARPERRGRSLRALALSARFVEGGTWRTAATLRQASGDPQRIRLTLAPRLAELPAPAESLALEVEAFGPPAQDQGRLVDERSPAEVRRGRIAEAVSQARQAVGESAALRILEVDPDSRLPERRAVLAPFPAEGDVS
jgi:protein ImuB